MSARVHAPEAFWADTPARTVRRGRHLGAYMQAELATEEERAAASRHYTPDAVMAETALLNF